MTDEELLDKLLDLWQRRREIGRELPTDQLAKHCPELAAELERRIEVLRRVEKLAAAAGQTSSAEKSE